MHMYTGKEGGSRRSGATAGSRRMKHEDSSLREPPDEDVIIVVVDLANSIPVYIVANATKGDLDNRCTREGMLSESETKSRRGTIFVPSSRRPFVADEELLQLVHGDLPGSTGASGCAFG